MQAFKVEYTWWEGEHSESLLAKNIEKEQFDKDIIEARDYAQSLIGGRKSNHMENYNFESLPAYYHKIIEYLIDQKGYVEIHTNDDISYDIDDNNKIIDVTKVEINKIRSNGKPGGKFVKVNEYEI